MTYKKLFSDSLIMVFSQFVSLISPLLIFAVTSKIYPPEIVYANLVTLSIMGFFSIVNDIGLYQYYVKRFAGIKSDKDKLSWLITVAFGQKFFTSICCMLILLILILFESYRQIIDFLLIGSLGAIAQAFQPIWFYNGVEKMSVYAASNITTKLMGLLLMWGLVGDPSNHYIPAICFTFSNVLLTLYLLFDIRRRKLIFRTAGFGDVFSLMLNARFYVFSRTFSAATTHLIVLVLGASTLSMAGIFAIADQIYKSIKVSISPIVLVIIPFTLRNDKSSFLIYFTCALFVVGALMAVAINAILADVVQFIWGEIPDYGFPTISVYTYAGVLAMFNAVLGFPWFGWLGYYDRANVSLVWASGVMLTLLFYAVYVNDLFLTFVVIIGELFLLIFRVFHLVWLKSR